MHLAYILVMVTQLKVKSKIQKLCFLVNPFQSLFVAWIIQAHIREKISKLLCNSMAIKKYLFSWSPWRETQTLLSKFLPICLFLYGTASPFSSALRKKSCIHSHGKQPSPTMGRSTFPKLWFRLLNWEEEDWCHDSRKIPLKITDEAGGTVPVQWLIGLCWSRFTAVTQCSTGLPFEMLSMHSFSQLP